MEDYLNGRILNFVLSLVQLSPSLFSIFTANREYFPVLPVMKLNQKWELYNMFSNFVLIILKEKGGLLTENKSIEEELSYVHHWLPDWKVFLMSKYKSQAA